MIAEVPIFITYNRVNNFNIEDYQRLGGSLERKVGYGYNVLAEVDILLQSLQSSPNCEVDPAAKNYALENELTAACEAVDSGRYAWFSFRPWDSQRGEFRAFGTSFMSMLQAGVDDMRNKVEHDHMEQYTFELNRRSAELATEWWITHSYQAGRINNQVFLTVSPYPEEIAEEVASTLGYKPAERLGKLRFEVFVNQVRQTIELSVARGSVRIFKRLVEHLGYDSSAFTDSTSFLKAPVLVGESSNYLQTIIDFAKRYDTLIEGQDSSSLYFCGQPVKSAQEKNYEKIIDRQHWVRERGTGLVEGIYNLNLELAKSLYQGIPTKQIAQSLNYWLTVKDQKGAPLLSEEDLKMLEQTVNTQRMSRDTAFILKKNELVRMWSIMACVVNEDQAKLMFGERFVSSVKGMVESTTINTPPARYFVDQMIAQVNPIFLACGGSLGSFGGQGIGSLFQMPLSSVRETLLGGSDKYGSLEFECEYCHVPNRRPYGVLLTSYQCCGRQISRCSN